MEVEAEEIPALATELHATLEMVLPPLVEGLRARAPSMLVTLARGSSLHAAAYGAALVELRLGLPTVPLPLVLASVHGRSLRVSGAQAIAVSQSGESPDLVTSIGMLRSHGGSVLAVVNASDSPVACAADDVIEIGAGPEAAVAATKTFMLSALALAHLVARWSDGAALTEALARLPDVLGGCTEPARDAILTTLARRESVYVIARGPALPVARELALKLKEVCGLHAEPFSAAEVLHGPLALAGPNLPVLVFEGDAATRPSIEAAVARFQEAGSPVVRLGTGKAPGAHPWLQPLVTLQAAYAWLVMLAAARGRDPDQPPHVTKVTRTR